MSQFRKFLVTITLLLLVTGCDSLNTATEPQQFKSVITSLPTITLTATATLHSPSATPLPSSTLQLPTATPLPATATPTSTATPTELPMGLELVSLKTEDGFDLVGYLHHPKTGLAHPVAVLLAHEYYSSHHSWEPFANLLSEAGFTTLSFDFRGHGASPGGKDFGSVGIDVAAGLDHLRNQGFEHVVCMGASMGASGCLAASVDTPLTGLVNLSGPMNIPGGLRLVSQQDLKNLTIPKIFMIAEDDQAAPDFVTNFMEMTEMAPEPKAVYVYSGYAHGNGLFHEDFGEDVEKNLLDFMIALIPGSQ